MEDLVASSGDYLYVIKTVNIHSEQLKLVNLDFLTLSYNFIFEILVMIFAYN